jgi:hypothetical protein
VEGFPVGRKPLERRFEAVMFQGKAHERKGMIERSFRSAGRINALKSEAQERWGMKNASKGSGV